MLAGKCFSSEREIGQNASREVETKKQGENKVKTIFASSGAPAERTYLANGQSKKHFPEEKIHGSEVLTLRMKNKERIVKGEEE